MRNSVISPNWNFFRQLLAVCTKGETAAVSVWDLTSKKKQKTLTCSEVTSDCYMSATFSSDDKILAAQGEGPDWTLVLFVLEKGKASYLKLVYYIKL